MSDAVGDDDVDLELFGGAVDDIEAAAPAAASASSAPSSSAVLDSLEDGDDGEVPEDPFATRAAPEGASRTFYTQAPMSLPGPTASVYLLKKHPAVEFAPDGYDELLADKGDVARPCVVRYRELPDGTRQSNARVVRWSDGRVDLVVGAHKIALNPMSQAQKAQPARFLYERVGEDLMQCVGAVKAKLQTSISAELTKEARAYLSTRSRAAAAASSVEIRAETKGPEEDMREVLREEAARRKMRLAEERMQRKHRKQQYGGSSRRGGPPEELTEDYLNQSDDDEAEAHGVGHRARERPQAANDPEAHQRLLDAQRADAADAAAGGGGARGRYVPSSDEEDEADGVEGAEDVEDDLNGFIVNEADEGDAPPAEDEEEDEDEDEASDDDDEDDDDKQPSSSRRERSKGPSLAAQLLSGPIAGEDESDDDDFEFDEDSEDDDEDADSDELEQQEQGAGAGDAEASPKRARPEDGSQAAAEVEDKRKVKRRRVVADSDSE